MRKLIFAASIAAAALVPSIASAQTRSQATCEQQRSTRVVATVAGAGVGGVLGNVVAGNGDKTLGTVIGAVGGAIVGNQIAKPGRECDDAYGYYDSENRWHATGVNPVVAKGYYDRDGNWIEGPPNGRYGDGNRWISNGSGRGDGVYRGQNEWVPASANGYYDRNDQWIAGSDTGYYDNQNRWVAGTAVVQSNRRADAYGYYDAQSMWHANTVAGGRATGYYDRDNNWVRGAPNGYYDERRNWVPLRDDGSASGSYDSHNRWIPASSGGYYDTNGQWVAGTSSGYYDQRGRWVAGVTVGHYDGNGRWIAGAASGHRDANGMWVADLQPGYYDTSGRWHAGATAGYYDTRGRWISTMQSRNYAAARPMISAQLSSLDRYVRDARAQRTLNGRDAAYAQRELDAIHYSAKQMRHDRAGNLNSRDQAKLQARIDRLNTRLGIAAR
jgi:uncharacterized protein YcfJ